MRNVILRNHLNIRHYSPPLFDTLYNCFAFFFIFLSLRPHVIRNFKPHLTFRFQIPREELILQVNMAPLVPVVVEKPAVEISNSSKNNVTAKNDTSSNETKIMRENVVSRDYLRNRKLFFIKKTTNSCNETCFDSSVIRSPSVIFSSKYFASSNN